MLSRLQIFHNQKRHDLLFEIVLRIVVFIAFVITDDAIAFRRKIQPEEAWLYSFPHSGVDIISAEKVHTLNVLSSIVIVWMVYKFNNDIQDAITALLGVSLSTFLSLTITNVIKISIGRPRPDFFERCYSVPPLDPHELAKANCDRPDDLVNQGYKSFPSGHATMAFGCMAYLSFYLARTFHIFDRPGHRMPCLKFCAFLTPLLCAILICASRTCDYHHHWQDVTVGSIIGIVIAYMCYRQGFSCFMKKDGNVFKGSLSPPPLTAVQSF